MRAESRVTSVRDISDPEGRLPLEELGKLVADKRRGLDETRGGTISSLALTLGALLVGRLQLQSSCVHFLRARKVGASAKSATVCFSSERKIKQENEF